MSKMNKSLALSLSCLVMMGALSGCVSSSPNVGNDPLVNASTGSETLTPKALDTTAETMRIDGERVLHNIYLTTLSAGDQKLQEASTTSETENMFIPLEDAFKKNEPFIENLEKNLALSDEFDQQISSLAKRSNVSEQTVNRYFLFKERGRIFKTRDARRLSKDLAPDENVGIFPGTMKNNEGDFVLTSENSYVKNNDGAIIRPLSIDKGVLSDDGTQIVLHQKPDSNENKSALSYDAKLYVHFQKTTVTSLNSAMAFKALNKNPFSPETTYRLTKKHGNTYIKVTDPQSVLDSGGVLLFKFDTLK